MRWMKKINYTFFCSHKITKLKIISLLRIFCSVADPGFLSRILIFTHPGSRIPDLRSQIPDPKTATNERGDQKLVVISYFVATKCTKLKIILFLKFRRKKFGPVFKEL
jgi:hypothetical protein